MMPRRFAGLAALGEHAPSILVAGLSSAFGVTLLGITGVLGQVIAQNGPESATVSLILSFIALVFVAIALFVGSVVTANTFATIIAGRARTIALLRLLGATAVSQRRAVAREGLLVGVVGGVLGAVVGIALTASVVAVGTRLGIVPAGTYHVVETLTLLPIVAVAVTTVAASWVGSRRVLVVSPMEATGAASETSLDEQNERRTRNVVAALLFVGGGGVVAAGVLLGTTSPLGVLVGLVGGLISFSGVVLGANVVMPRALRIVGRAFGRSPTAILARENAVRYPERSSRSTVGLVIGVTLITTFAVTVETFLAIIRAAQQAQPEVYAGTEEILQTTVAVFSVVIAFSALTAAVGMVNNLSLNVLQRTRELGLLRALGFTSRQVRRMILIESAQLSAASVVVGLVLGIGYGWAGAQSLVGSITGSPGIILPAVPLAVVGVIVLASALLAAAASVAPSRRATRISPVEALAAQ